jgi:hypothetical protein
MQSFFFSSAAVVFSGKLKYFGVLTTLILIISVACAEREHFWHTLWNFYLLAIGYQS